MASAGTLTVGGLPIHSMPDRSADRKPAAGVCRAGTLGASRAAGASRTYRRAYPAADDSRASHGGSGIAGWRPLIFPASMRTLRRPGDCSPGVNETGFKSLPSPPSRKWRSKASQGLREFSTTPLQRFLARKKLILKILPRGSSVPCGKIRESAALETAPFCL